MVLTAGCCSEDANFNDPIEIADFEIAEGAPPLFSFGVIADIQYADLDDGKSFGGSTRYFRRALEITQHAVDAWDQTDIRFIAQLGDLIDGRNKDAGLSDSSLNAVSKQHSISQHQSCWVFRTAALASCGTVSRVFSVSMSHCFSVAL